MASTDSAPSLKASNFALHRMLVQPLRTILALNEPPPNKPDTTTTFHKHAKHLTQECHYEDSTETVIVAAPASVLSDIQGVLSCWNVSITSGRNTPKRVVRIV
ncbi:MAG: hypothetical protein ACXVCM_22230 [Ktedonobacteraceae bacterium]